MGEEPDAIRADIEETRARMGERAEALAYKADVPARSKDKVHDVTDSIKEKVTSVTDKVTGKAHSATETVSDKAHGITGTVSDKAHGLKDKLPSGGSGEGVGQKAARAKNIAQDNPLGLAIGSLAAGFLAGLLIPTTKVEQEKLAPMAEKAFDKASDMADTVKEKVVDQAKDKANEAAGVAATAVKEHLTSSSSSSS